MDKISVVVPCYNEEEALPVYYKEMCRVMDEMKDVANAAEEKIPDEELPYPTYDQMLFYV